MVRFAETVRFVKTIRFADVGDESAACFSLRYGAERKLRTAFFRCGAEWKLRTISFTMRCGTETAAAECFLRCVAWRSIVCRAVWQCPFSPLLPMRGVLLLLCRSDLLPVFKDYMFEYQHYYHAHNESVACYRTYQCGNLGYGFGRGE